MMATRAREVYRLVHALAPEVLPEPSDVATWKVEGTDTGFVVVEVEYYVELSPMKTKKVRHYV